MSKAKDYIEALRVAIAEIADPAFAVTTVIQPVGRLADRTVLLIADRATREPAGGNGQRWSLNVLVIVRSKLESDESGSPAIGRMLDDVDAVLAKLRDTTALNAGGEVFQNTQRGAVQYWVHSQGDHGRPAGGLLMVTGQWVE